MKTISLISAPASILGFLWNYFLISHNKITPFQIIFLVIYLISTIIIIYYSNKRKVFKSQYDIDTYMIKWLSNIGRTVVLTRDMSWASESRINDVLMNKARKKELIILTVVKNETIVELEKNGARIIDYSSFNYVPKSRFTIVHFGRNDYKVAIGKTHKNKHYIEEYENGEHHTSNLSLDIVNILMSKEGVSI